MSEGVFRIPKQTDENLILALVAIKAEVAKDISLRIIVVPHDGAASTLISNEAPLQDEKIDFVVSEHSQLMPGLKLVSGDENEVLVIHREAQSATDRAKIIWPDSNQGWHRNISSEKRSKFFVRLKALARRHLRACDAEASLSGTTESEWSRYRDSQQAILNSLAETQRTAVTELSRKILEAEQTAKARYLQQAEALQAEFDTNKSRYDQEHADRMAALAEREAALKAKEEAFNTREPRYVARKEQEKQINDIKNWLEDWSLTRGTKSKRWPVAGAYVAGLITTAGFTIWFGAQNLELLKDQNLAEIAWWQWVLLTVKTVIPFAAFSTFLIYFIRWSSAWARQHAEEEFRNRSRLLDIGRAAWLMEAVRDAQDNQRELPPDLLKELARNLFVQNDGIAPGDINPQALSELLLHGLASIRVKSADGSEVEATRDRKAK